MLKILFIGDVFAKLGRETVQKVLPKIKSEYHPDLVIANAENSAHGNGVTKSTIKELMDAGVDYMTTGDHAFDQSKQIEECYDGSLPVIRPANFSAGVPGKGYAVIKIKKHNILLINLIGRVFMHMDYDCPFRELDRILAKDDLANLKLSAILVDVHAEATSEKTCLRHYADGRVSAVLGTHTHVMTADHKITKSGTAYITDVGMVGAANESIGLGKEGLIKTFLTQMKYERVVPEKGDSIFNSVLVTIDPKTAKAKTIKPISKIINIK